MQFLFVKRFNSVQNCKELFQMPPKKVKRGGQRENAGRKVDSTGKYSKEKTPEERRRASRESRAKSRGQEKIPEARIIGETSSAVQKSPSLFVRRFDEEDIKLVLVSRIQLLGTELANKTGKELRRQM